MFTPFALSVSAPPGHSSRWAFLYSSERPGFNLKPEDSGAFPILGGIYISGLRGPSQGPFPSLQEPSIQCISPYSAPPAG